MFYRLYELVWEFNDPTVSLENREAMLPVKRTIVISTILCCLSILSLPFIYLLLKQVI